MGATTIWERWNSMLPDGSFNPGEMTSFNHHALGSIVNWLHEVVGGISPLDPGWKHVLLRPVPGGSLTSAQVKHDSLYGRVSCSWCITEGLFKLSLEVPPNCKATVVMPDKQASKVLGQTEQGVEVGSGHYEFLCKHEPEKYKPKPIRIPFYKPVKDELWFEERVRKLPAGAAFGSCVSKPTCRPDSDMRYFHVISYTYSEGTSISEDSRSSSSQHRIFTKDGKR